MGWDRNSEDTDLLKVAFFAYVYACFGLLFFKAVVHFTGFAAVLAGCMYHTFLVASMCVLITMIFSKD